MTGFADVADSYAAVSIRQLATLGIAARASPTTCSYTAHGTGVQIAVFLGRLLRQATT